VVTFWVRTARLGDGLERRLLDALRTWFATAWAFDLYLFHTNETLDQQVATIEQAGLHLMFRLTEPDKPATSLAYAEPRLSSTPIGS
jgi:hypothetical protein